jgi:hypothetical protein
MPEQTPQAPVRGGPRVTFLPQRLRRRRLHLRQHRRSVPRKAKHREH